jgi:hypothetical protein
MKLKTWLTSFATLALFGLLLGGPLLTAQDPKSLRPTEGFTGQYVLIEKKDGERILLHKPEVRTLAGKTYLVGRTITVPGVTEDELFEQTAQWVGVENVRRMGEADSINIIAELREIARRRAIREQERLTSVGK